MGKMGEMRKMRKMGKMGKMGKPREFPIPKEPEAVSLSSNNQDVALNAGHFTSFVCMKSIQPKSIGFAAIGGLLLIPVASAGLWWTSSVAQQPQPANISQNNSSLSPVSPDEPVDYTLNERFSLSNSLERIQQIKNALSSFQQLTEASRPMLGDRTIAEIGHTGWETQYLGFPNWLGSVEGTLQKQAYQIAKLEFELAQKQFQDGEISQAVLEQKEAKYRRAEQDFQAFWNSFTPVD